MTESIPNLPPLTADAPQWQALLAHGERLRGGTLSGLFAADPQRVDRFTFRAEGILADFSRQRLDAPARAALFELARAARLEDAIAALFAGEPLNFTEQRAALHMAMRGGAPMPAQDAAMLQDTDARMRDFSRRFHSGALLGHDGTPLRTVIHLGIGGSDLGPRLACEALAPVTGAPVVRFVANLDPHALEAALAGVDPRETLFILSSKSFRTTETLNNARAARAWLEQHFGRDQDFTAHFAAVTHARDDAIAYGVAPAYVFALPVWVGGRYSVWSAVGLPVLLSLGEAGFDALLNGAREMDAHFRTHALEDNLPVQLGLVDLWNASVLKHGTRAVLPYAHGLRTLPAWMQQLEMESNGKRCQRNAQPCTLPTAPVVWGMEGTLGQHAFHQLLYQGMRDTALEFIVVRPHNAATRQLAENALAQAAALMQGRSLERARAHLAQHGYDDGRREALAPHLTCRGEQPSTTLLLPALTPHTLGRLLALYEHKVFVQGWIWGINSFDQFGVELGKELAHALNTGQPPDDPATHALLAEFDAPKAADA